MAQGACGPADGSTRGTYVLNDKILNLSGQVGGLLTRRCFGIDTDQAQELAVDAQLRFPHNLRPARAWHERSLQALGAQVML